MSSHEKNIILKGLRTAHRLKIEFDAVQSIKLNQMSALDSIEKIMKSDVK